MNRGYIKLWNKLRDSCSYSRGGVHRAVLLTVFVEATRKTSFFRGVELKPGQMAVSVMGLAEDLGFPRTTVQRALSDLASDGVITVENMGNRWTRITLINWNVYQVDFEQTGQPMGNQRATDGQPVGTLKDIKNINTPEIPNGISVPTGDTATPRKKVVSTIFRPPTMEEVEAYCRERGNAVDAEKWWNFYQSKGWVVGKSKMRDWKAAVRTWERDESKQMSAATGFRNRAEEREAHNRAVCQEVYEIFSGRDYEQGVFDV